MPKKKAVDENIVGVPNFEDMDDDELERQATVLKLKKEWLAVARKVSQNLSVNVSFAQSEQR